jgi:hypothetical protein
VSDTSVPAFPSHITACESLQRPVCAYSCTLDYSMFNHFVSPYIAEHKCMFNFIEVNSLINDWKSNEFLCWILAGWGVLFIETKMSSPSKRREMDVMKL